MIAALGCMPRDWAGRVRPPAIFAAFALTVAALPGAGSGQTAPQDPHQARAMGTITAMPMIMPTDDHKVFRLVRPTVAAIQIRLLEAGTFSGSVNGLLGPSTVRALTIYQRSHGLDVTGLPDGRTVLDLMGLQERFGELEDHFEMGPVPSSMATQRMAESDVRAGMPGGGPMVDGDPQPAKSLMLMRMPGMVMDNRHTRSVRAVREVVAAFQLRLSDEGLFDGVRSGSLMERGFKDAVLRYQAQQGLEETSSVDLATALSLLGSDAEHLISEHRARIDLEATPVAMDGALMRLSDGRRQTNPPRRECDE